MGRSSPKNLIFRHRIERVALQVDNESAFYIGWLVVLKYGLSEIAHIIKWHILDRNQFVFVTSLCPIYCEVKPLVRLVNVGCYKIVHRKMRINHCVLIPQTIVNAIIVHNIFC